MPLNQEIEHRHHESQTHFKIRPDPLGKVFEMRDECEHRQKGLNQHPRIPFAAFANFEVRGRPTMFDKMGIDKHHHVVSDTIHQVLKGRTVVDIGNVTILTHQAQMIEQNTQFSSDNPTPIGQAFASDLLFAASFAARMQQFNPEAIRQSQQTGRCQEGLCPYPMCFQGAKQARAFRQAGKQRSEVVAEPAIEGAATHPFERKDPANCDQLAGIQVSLRMFYNFWHLIIHAAKQMNDKIFVGHSTPRSLLSENSRIYVVRDFFQLAPLVM
jgi:hypothetical protein